MLEMLLALLAGLNASLSISFMCWVIPTKID